MRIDKNLERILKRVEKPARYTGGEVNMIRKNPDDVSLRIGFAFPDTYEIGMSYMGMQILYNILNKNEKIYCERLFAPAGDMEALMREDNIKLFTLETFTPADELDILGFTLQYEMSYSNILNMMDLAGIPVRREDRADSMYSYPLIIAGGPCAFNPEPLADFVDIFLVGDGEELLEKVCLAFADAKAKKLDRRALLEQAAGLDGVYVPEFYDIEYESGGPIKSVTVLNSIAP